MYKALLFVGLGGGIGSIARYLISSIISEKSTTSFPLGTFLVNIIGCLLIGLIYGTSERFSWLNTEWRFFLAAGLCGGFTTFSAFTYESLVLLKEGHIFQLAFYAALSVFVGISVTWLGYTIMKTI